MELRFPTMQIDFFFFLAFEPPGILVAYNNELFTQFIGLVVWAGLSGVILLLS